MGFPGLFSFDASEQTYRMALVSLVQDSLDQMDGPFFVLWTTWTQQTVWERIHQLVLNIEVLVNWYELSWMLGELSRIWETNL